MRKADVTQDVLNIALTIALSERLHASMQVNTKLASGALSGLPGDLLRFRPESLNVLCYAR